MTGTPIGSGISDLPLAATGLGTMGWLALVLLLGTFALLLYAIRQRGCRRAELTCPADARRATVVFRIAADGSASDVGACSHFGRRAVDCVKSCLALAARA